MRCNFHQLCAVVLLLILETASAAPADMATVRLSFEVDPGFQYDATVSQHVGMKVDDRVHRVNLMLPPEMNLDLCQQEGSPLNGASGALRRPPVALLVDPGNCTIRQQIETAVVLKQTHEPDIGYLIFQGNGSENPNVLPDPIAYLAGVTTGLPVDGIGFLFVSIWSGRSIHRVVESSSTSSNSPSPYLFGPGNEDWHLKLVITPGNNGNVYVDKKSPGWVICLSLLVAFGVFTLYGYSQSCTRDTSRQGFRVSVNVVKPELLTRSDVLALPEIVYHAEPERKSIPLEACDGDCEAPHPSTSDNCKSTTATTTSTVCSICIQDFEEGEKIRLLPLCGHAYHTDCVIPWLTERYGICPSCRTCVGKQGNDDEHNGNTSSSLGASCHDIGREEEVEV